jgi:DNA-binding transcriptional ArsR family regulator
MSIEGQATEKDPLQDGADGLSQWMGEEAGLSEAVGVMRLLSSAPRLKILCHLCTEGEMSVGALLERVPLSPSALSQHLGRLRSEGLVETRKERQTVYYRVEREDVARILWTLHGLYCGC